MSNSPQGIGSTAIFQGFFPGSWIGDDIHQIEHPVCRPKTASNQAKTRMSASNMSMFFFGYYPITHIHKKVSQLRDDSMAIPLQ